MAFVAYGVFLEQAQAQSELGGGRGALVDEGAEELVDHQLKLLDWVHCRCPFLSQLSGMSLPQWQGVTHLAVRNLTIATCFTRVTIETYFPLEKQLPPS